MIVKFIAIYFFICVLIDRHLKADGYKGPKTDHFNGRHFKNYFNGGSFRKRLHERAGDELPALSFFLKKFRSVWKKRSLPNGKAIPKPRIVGKEIVVTFVNHSTVLIQTEGLNILTDPVWSKRSSPASFFGPARCMEPGVDIVDLPEIDFILLSHNHYDHMDISALKMISKRDKPIIYTTLGNNKYLKKKGIIKGVDMDWGESKKFSDLITVECVPAQHFSARAFSDRNKTLWGGFVIKGAHGDIYFAGDTGYGPFIEHIKKIYPDGFRLAFLPIGAFKPKSFMGEIHLSPDDAIDIYKDLKIKHAIPVHFGTFDLALDKQDEPIEHLKKHLSEAKNSDVDFKILLNGQHVSLK